MLSSRLTKQTQFCHPFKFKKKKKRTKRSSNKTETPPKLPSYINNDEFELLQFLTSLQFVFRSFFKSAVAIGSRAVGWVSVKKMWRMFSSFSGDDRFHLIFVVFVLVYWNHSERIYFWVLYFFFSATPRGKGGEGSLFSMEPLRVMRLMALWRFL